MLKKISPSARAAMNIVPLRDLFMRQHLWADEEPPQRITAGQEYSARLVLENWHRAKFFAAVLNSPEVILRAELKSDRAPRPAARAATKLAGRSRGIAPPCWQT